VRMTDHPSGEHRHASSAYCKKGGFERSRGVWDERWSDTFTGGGDGAGQSEHDEVFYYWFNWLI